MEYDRPSLNPFYFSEKIFALVAGAVMINDYHHLMGEKGRAFIKKLHDSHVGRACNDVDCNGSTICIYHEQKTSA